MTKPSRDTVFVIDDDEAVRDSLKLLLESHLLTVRDFASAPEFLEAVEPLPRGCLVLDLHLPVLSGLDFLGRYVDGDCGESYRRPAARGGHPEILLAPGRA